MGQNINKFLLLMWKNLIILKRNPKHTVVEIIAPVLFCLVLVIVRGLISPAPHSAKFYNSFENQIPVLEKLKSPIEIAWSPKNQVLKKIILHTINAISTETITIYHKPFKNRRALENYLNNTFNTPRTLAGIAFNDSLATAKTLAYHIDVTLRFPGELRSGLYTYLQSYNLIDYSWKTNLLFPLYQFSGPRSYDVHTGAEPSYYYEGFLKLQQEISCAIINYLKQKVSNQPFDCQSAHISMRRFPAPRWIDDETLQTLQPFLGLIILLSFIYNSINMVKLITTEKEKQLKEAMKIMGLPNWLHWTVWFVKSILISLLVIFIITVMLKAKWYHVHNIAIFPNSNAFVIILFLLTYSCATITFCFAVSVFFSKANTAASIAGVLWFINYFPFLLTQNSVTTTSLLQKLLVSLFFNSAMGYGFQLILMFESKEEGIQWDNIWKTASPDGNLVLGHLIIMLIVDSFIHLMITLYVDAVFPGDYGVAKPWNFLFLKSTWFSKQYHNDTFKLENECYRNEFHEKEPCNLPVSIQIKQLRKEFSKKVAVNDVCLNIFQNQITILLGHNGAGKTTTMSILTGMLPPTKGTAIINGYDIRTDMQKIRHGLGLCPQHNILFDNFTVYEHLYFYGQLKGISKSDIESEINKYINLLRFEDKVNSRASTLSGGMQRKLSVGIALCGGSKIVMLDEPTEGMDPNSRRDLWKLLNKQKEGRTILLTTHFMDEADLLGDRIAIMAKGQIQCCGSSFFLKKKYGAGYHLIIVKSSKCDVNNITKLLKKYVPDVIIESNIGSELTFSLSEELSSVFESMLTDLERNSSELGILSFGISLMTLEDVFMKVGTECNDEEPYIIKKSNSQQNTAKAKETINYFNEIQNSSKNDSTNTFNLNHESSHVSLTYVLWYRQLLAMILKRSIFHLRSWLLIIIHNVIPVICLVLAVIIMNASNLNQDLPSRKLELDSYKNAVTVLTFNKENKYFEKYINILESNNNTVLKWQNENMTMNMYEKSKENKAEVSMRYIVGATFEQNNSITAWFNNEPYHSPPLSLQLVLNAILHKEVSPNYSLQFYNHPQPFGPETKFAQLIQTSAMGFQIALNIGFSMAFVTAYYIIFCIQERVCKSKHLQFVSGVNVLIFWIASFICDLFTFICTSVWILITFLVLRLESYSSNTELICIFIVLMCFGFATIPQTYLASFLFEVPSTGYTKLILFNIFTGIAFLIIAQILTAGSLKLECISESLHWVFLINPHYSLSTAVRDINSMYAIKNHCNKIMDECLTIRSNTLFTFKVCKSIICKKKSICCELPDSYLSWKAPGIGRNLIYMSSLGVVSILILLLIEYRCFDKFLNKFWFNYYYPPPPSSSNEDSDVKTENEKIRSASQEEINKYNIVLRNITKYYNKFLAVNNVCIGINNYECFGLLGINGAGKTTMFKMMTGDMQMSSGNVWINGLNIQTNMKILSRSIGYCPQFDALLDRLTCRETLTIFGLIRGLKLKECKITLESLSRRLNFYQHIDKKVEELSKGNRRKLSTAIALLGDPTTLFLDEPTAGMDPESKRCFWNEICTLRNSGKCIVITSHSMEECEALCTRLTIMVNGQFKCLGSIQHLKSKFSQGYTLTIKIRKNLNTSELQEIAVFIRDKFQDVVLRDKHQELITYYISNKSLPWSKLFGIMELAKQSLHIEDYSLGQCSLEQVFLTFAKHQHESKNNLLESGIVTT